MVVANALFCSAHCSDFLHTIRLGNRYNPARARKDEQQGEQTGARSGAETPEVGQPENERSDRRP